MKYIFLIVLSSLSIYGTNNYHKETKLDNANIITPRLKNERHKEDYLNHLKDEENKKLQLEQEEKDKQKAQEDQKIKEEQQKDQPQAQQSDNQQKQKQQLNNSNQTSQPKTEPAATPAPQTQEDGFNLNGQHYDLSVYNNENNGQVPKWTPYVYRYPAIPNYYLAEGHSNAGIQAFYLQIGASLVLNGQHLRLNNIITVPREGADSWNQMVALGSQHKAVLQTCLDANSVNLKIMIFD